MLMDNISSQYSKFWPGLKINEDRNTILLRQAMKVCFTIMMKFIEIVLYYLPIFVTETNQYCSGVVCFPSI